MINQRQAIMFVIVIASLEHRPLSMWKLRSSHSPACSACLNHYYIYVVCIVVLCKIRMTFTPNHSINVLAGFLCIWFIGIMPHFRHFFFHKIDNSCLKCVLYVLFDFRFDSFRFINNTLGIFFPHYLFLFFENNRFFLHFYAIECVCMWCVSNVCDCEHASDILFFAKIHWKYFILLSNALFSPEIPTPSCSNSVEHCPSASFELQAQSQHELIISACDKKWPRCVSLSVYMALHAFGFTSKHGIILA